MPLVYMKHITRKKMKEHPEMLFVFGDNIHRRGFGGQAKEMRGELNAVGLPTKRTPEHNDEAYLRDDMLSIIMATSASDVGRLVNHLVNGGTVVWPEDGIGTGLADLANRAPTIRAFYDNLLTALKRISLWRDPHKGKPA